MKGRAILIRAKFLKGNEIDMDFSDGMSVTVDFKSVFKSITETLNCKECEAEYNRYLNTPHLFQNFKVLGEMLVWDYKIAINSVMIHDFIMKKEMEKMINQGMA